MLLVLGREPSSIEIRTRLLNLESSHKLQKLIEHRQISSLLPLPFGYEPYGSAGFEPAKFVSSCGQGASIR